LCAPERGGASLPGIDCSACAADVEADSGTGVGEDFSYVSTAGGAFLEWLDGRDLPGVAALKRAA